MQSICNSLYLPLLAYCTLNVLIHTLSNNNTTESTKNENYKVNTHTPLQNSLPGTATADQS